MTLEYFGEKKNKTFLKYTWHRSGMAKGPCCCPSKCIIYPTWSQLYGHLNPNFYLCEITKDTFQNRSGCCLFFSCNLKDVTGAQKVFAFCFLFQEEISIDNDRLYFYFFPSRQLSDEWLTFVRAEPDEVTGNNCFMNKSKCFLLWLLRVITRRPPAVMNEWSSAVRVIVRSLTPGDRSFQHVWTPANVEPEAWV